MRMLFSLDSDGPWQEGATLTGGPREVKRAADATGHRAILAGECGILARPPSYHIAGALTAMKRSSPECLGMPVRRTLRRHQRFRVRG